MALDKRRIGMGIVALFIALLLPCKGLMVSRDRVTPVPPAVADLDEESGQTPKPQPTQAPESNNVPWLFFPSPGESETPDASDGMSAYIVFGHKTEEYTYVHDTNEDTETIVTTGLLRAATQGGILFTMDLNYDSMPDAQKIQYEVYFRSPSGSATWRGYETCTIQTYKYSDNQVVIYALLSDIFDDITTDTRYEHFIEPGEYRCTVSKDGQTLATATFTAIEDERIPLKVVYEDIVFDGIPLSPGTILELVNTDDGYLAGGEYYFLARYRGKEAYVKGDAVRIITDIEIYDALEELDPWQPQTFVRIDSKGSVNVRIAGNVDSERIGTAQTGNMYPLLGISSSGWYKIRLEDGTEGYISPNMAEIVEN